MNAPLVAHVHPPLEQLEARAGWIAGGIEGDDAGIHISSKIYGLEIVQTPTTLGGETLSAGQAQRIALARALYRDPFLIVLDEPNSNLDAAGDEALTRAILGIRARGGIVVVIAHRPSAIAGVDLLPDKDGRTPLAHARAAGQTAVVKVLESIARS